MPNPNAIVSMSVHVETGAGAAPAAGQAGDALVRLDDGRSVRLALDDRATAGFLPVLRGLEQLRHPVYLELDPKGAITRVLIPRIGRIVEIKDTDEGYDLLLDASHARHRMRRDDPDFGEMDGVIRRSHDTDTPLVVTSDEAQRVIDVRPYLPGPNDRLLPPFRRDWAKPALKRRWTDYFLWIPFLRGCVSRKRAQQVFDTMNATSCDPASVPPPCIPFLFPDDGCWGRAHEMCRLMLALGLSPRKVWIQGRLDVATRNNPTCFVRWGWHVAPTLCVRVSWFKTQRMVIDPSLFATPVSQATWKGVQGDPAATLTPSDASIFYLWGGVTDPTYAQTNMVLATYRLQLQNRTVLHGPPPYAGCP